MDGVTRRRFVAALGGGGASVLVSGCTNRIPGVNSKPPLDQVNVRLVDVRRPDTGFTSATLPLILGFENPTDRRVPDISGDLDVFINDTRIGSDEPVINALEPGEETMYEMDILFEYSDVGEAVVDAVKSGSFSITVRGTLNAGSATDSVSVSASV